MSSQYPPDDQKKSGFRKKMRSGAKWFKGLLRGSSVTRPTPEHSEHLAAPSIGPQNLSFSRASTPLVAPAPPPADPGLDQGPTLPVESSTLAHVPEAEVNTITENDTTASEIRPQNVSQSGPTASSLAPSPPVDLAREREETAPPPDPSTQASAPASEADATPEKKKPGSAAWARMIGSLEGLKTSVELFPPLKSAVGAFIGSLDIVQKAASNRADYEELADEFRSMADMLQQYAGDLESEPNNGSIANIAQCIQRQVTEIEKKEESGTIGHLLDATQDQEDIIRRYRQVERLFRQLQYDLSMRTRNDVKKQLEITLLQRMPSVDDAKYNSSYSNTIRRHRCTAKTREAIRQALQDWSTNPNSEKIYWMNGMAGTGKTTIAYSFCEWLEDTNRLGASFFCSRISSTCRSLSQIVPTIAYQLAHFSPAYRSKLCSILNNSPDAGRLNVVQQFEKLINQPMLNAKDAMPDSVVIVIDALDECDDYYSVRLLLNVLLKFAERLPLKFFVASRPEPVIRDRMVSQGGSSRFIVYLHDIEQSIVEEDIKKYFIEAFRPMEPPPPPAQIQLLAERSRNLFIYAATVVRYIYPDDVSVDSSARLELMLEAIDSAKAMSSNRYEDLDLLYTTVLSAVFKKRLEEGEKDWMQRVLRTVVCAREPVTTVTIASLARLSERQVWSALQSLRSVVHVPENSNLISTLHASFPEYMLDESRSKELWCNEFKSNEAMVHRCFDVMKAELRFNICGLDSSYLTDDQVGDLEARVARCISPTLSYACRYWASHLQVTPPSDDTHHMILDFLSTQLLFWMEVLSLSGCIGIGAPMMQQAQTWLRQIANNRDEIQKQASDARNFLTWFAANPCSRSTPHIYVSALPLCAKSSWVYQHYFQHTSGLTSISVSQHDESILAVWTTESRVKSVAISPDGNQVVSGSQNGSVQVYDIHTGALVAGPFQEHTGYVWSVAFSPDGRHIASGSNDQRVIIWDAHTGRIVTGPLHKHTDPVLSVAFSPDGRRIVSGPDDKTIVVCDVFTGRIVYGPVEGHSARILSVAYSPDGRLIASGSQDKSIILWNASTGAAVATFKGHTGVVMMIAFSPDGTKLASCSDDKTIRLWDIKLCTAVGLPFQSHRDEVWSLAFSNNGGWIVSGGAGSDYDIIVWDALTGKVAFGPLSGHTDDVMSVAFTPDDTRIVSCSDDTTIRIWDLQQNAGAAGQKPAHKHSAGPVGFMGDRTQLVANSSTGKLQLWDLHTGMIIEREFEEQAEIPTSYSIAVSPQQTRVAIGANDFTIRVWDIRTGKLVSQPLRGPKGAVRCLSFSPDGARLCSGSDDTTVMIWDVEAGAMAGQPYIGHTGPAISVMFSPDATQIASSSTDRTIRIWDSFRGILVHTLDTHNTSVSSISFSPDGSYIISGSVEGALQKWEARTGNCLHTLFEPEASYTSPNSDRYIPIHWVCFSPDGAYIASAFGSSVRLVGSQNSDIVSKLSLPSGEQVHWVGYALNGSDIVTVSHLEVAETKDPANESTQAPIQSPNIVRVWHAGGVITTDQRASPLTPGSWSYKPDGRVLSPDGLVMWIPPDLIPYMEEHTRLGSESYHSSVVWSPDRFINIGYPDLHIGKRWTECYISNR
ncbi:putative WD repeat-containing protein all2124 [Nostoc sp, PCC 7120] [Rhizoctonia solani]|uniref:Putative WD repeat-containing protein all2124 [Nostoc sp, PCC 7120] n=1 Tax=Rhizoctonia solani TaxID=456999 RepID=A0A0K6G8A3_9AGAM|nr:putative WD repeat-containing protein all2124 [Nostoc sp, PCC 7120] [Rhizoctonia solani]